VGSDDSGVRHTLIGEKVIRTIITRNWRQRLPILCLLCFRLDDYFQPAGCSHAAHSKIHVFAGILAHGVIPVLPHSAWLLGCGDEMLARIWSHRRSTIFPLKSDAPPRPSIIHGYERKKKTPPPPSGRIHAARFCRQCSRTIRNIVVTS